MKDCKTINRNRTYIINKCNSDVRTKLKHKGVKIPTSSYTENKELIDILFYGVYSKLNNVKVLVDRKVKNVRHR